MVRSKAQSRTFPSSEQPSLLAPTECRVFLILTASFSLFRGSILMDPILYPRRRHLDHSTPWGVDYPEYFLTICCRKMGTNQLCQNGVGERVLDLIRKYQKTHRWHCSIALLMPDHLHAIVQISRDLKLVSVLRNFKQACAKQAKVSWQRGIFEHRLRGNESAQQKYRYIEKNPVRAGLIKRAEDWPWRIQFNDHGKEF